MKTQDTTPLQTNVPANPVRGVVYGLTAAICYGLIPTFTLPVKDGAIADRMSDPSILFYRFLFASVIIGIIMLLRGRSFRVTRPELVTLTYLAFLSDGSALFLLDGYNYLPTGIATTLHFMYPVATTLLMMMFYHEARKLSTILAVLMAVAGVAALSWTGDGSTSLRGVVIELISAVCYALYIIRVNRSRVRDMDGMKLTFYVMLLGTAIFAADAYRQDSLQMIATTNQATYLLTLSIVCTVVTNLCLVAAVKNIGSTMTAVLGALEPLTAVALGCLLFSEAFTLNIFLGIALIIPAVVIIIFTRGRK